MSKSKTIATNKKARFNYEILETVEAGLVLKGSEVKSLREGHASLNESYAAEKHGEIYLVNTYIAEYKPANRHNHESRRLRQVLLTQKEKSRLLGKVNQDGMTLVPVSLYFNGKGIVKVNLGLGRGKSKVDKRETKKEQDWQRQKARALRDHR